MENILEAQWAEARASLKDTISEKALIDIVMETVKVKRSHLV